MNSVVLKSINLADKERRQRLAIESQAKKINRDFFKADYETKYVDDRRRSKDSMIDDLQVEEDKGVEYETGVLDFNLRQMIKDEDDREHFINRFSYDEIRTLNSIWSFVKAEIERVVKNKIPPSVFYRFIKNLLNKYGINQQENLRGGIPPLRVNGSVVSDVTDDSGLYGSFYDTDNSTYVSDSNSVVSSFGSIPTRSSSTYVSSEGSIPTRSSSSYVSSEGSVPTRSSKRSYSDNSRGSSIFASRSSISPISSQNSSRNSSRNLNLNLNRERILTLLRERNQQRNQENQGRRKKTDSMSTGSTGSRTPIRRNFDDSIPNPITPNLVLTPAGFKRNFPTAQTQKDEIKRILTIRGRNWETDEMYSRGTKNVNQRYETYKSLIN